MKEKRGLNAIHGIVFVVMGLLAVLTADLGWKLPHPVGVAAKMVGDLLIVFGVVLLGIVYRRRK